MVRESLINEYQSPTSSEATVWRCQQPDESDGARLRGGISRAGARRLLACRVSVAVMVLPPTAGFLLARYPFCMARAMRGERAPLRPFPGEAGLEGGATATIGCDNCYCAALPATCVAAGTSYTRPASGLTAVGSAAWSLHSEHHEPADRSHGGRVVPSRGLRST